MERAITPQRPDYSSPTPALIDLAGTDSRRRVRASQALWRCWPPPKNAIERAWTELGELGPRLVPDLVRTVVTYVAEEGFWPRHAASMVLGLQGEDGLTELVPLARHEDYVVRWTAYLGFEVAGPRARWAVPTLLRQFRIEPLPVHRDRILCALGTISGAESIAFLNHVVWDRRFLDQHRITAAEALREAVGCLPDLPVNDRG